MAYTPPEIKTANKDEIVKYIEEYLNSGNSLAHVNDLLYQIALPSHRHTSVARDIAYKMKATGKYDLKEEPIISGGANYFVSKMHIPEKTWAELNPIKEKIRTALITGFVTFLVSLIVGVILFRFQNRGQDELNEKRDQHLIRLDSSINRLEKRLADSIAILRADTSLRSK